MLCWSLLPPDAGFQKSQELPLGHQGARAAGGLGIAPAVLWCFDYEMSPINSCFKNFHLVVLLWKVLEPLASGVLV